MSALWTNAFITSAKEFLGLRRTEVRRYDDELEFSSVANGTRSSETEGDRQIDRERYSEYCSNSNAKHSILFSWRSAAFAGSNSLWCTRQNEFRFPLIQWIVCIIFRSFSSIVYTYSCVSRLVEMEWTHNKLKTLEQSNRHDDGLNCRSNWTLRSIVDVLIRKARFGRSLDAQQDNDLPYSACNVFRPKRLKLIIVEDSIHCTWNFFASISFVFLHFERKLIAIKNKTNWLIMVMAISFHCVHLIVCLRSVAQRFWL